VNWQFLRLNMVGPVALVTLDRPPANAVSQHMYEEIGDLFGRFDEVLTSAKAVVLTGAGRHFCAGNDLDEFLTLDADNSPGRMRVVADAFASIYDCPVPVIGAVRGAALGTGLAIAACCDLVVAGESARFGTPEVGVGVMGGARHLARLVPEPIMRLMYFTADPLPATELLAHGSVVQVVPDDELIDAAMSVARRITRHSRAALRHAKESLNAIEFTALGVGYEMEQRMTSRLVAHPDAREAIAALREGREPRFRDDPAEDAGDHA
jgi:enoyl-CoA hydratase